MAQTKRFRLKAEEISELVQSTGWCMASDRIMVDGARIGYMYRDTPVAGGDSGWRFLAGDEDDAYMRNDDNHGVYDLNTVANYDPSVIPYLGAKEKSAFDRTGETEFSLFEG